MWDPLEVGNCSPNAATEETRIHEWDETHFH
jgi:hypothetical protein